MIVQILVCVFSIKLVLNNEILGQTHASSHYKNQYGADYGKKWIFFPDGDGVPHNVNLTATSEQQEYQTYLRKGYYTDVEYQLYKSGNKENFTTLNEHGEPLVGGDEKLEFNGKAVKILTHGWKSSVDSPCVKDIKNAYLETQDVYVITADWSYIADSIFYHWVANETKTIGMQIASFLGAIYERYNVSGDKIHLIGHSLGAHVMGIAASASNLTIDRITALDPARPLFEYPSREASDKLDNSDATYVDVIHTCSGVLGIESAIGVVDFYPNNGIPPQPGCESIQNILEACSHGRSCFYFAESIRFPEAFPAYQCENWADYLENRCPQHGFMGENVNRNETGKMFLKTKRKSPFGRRT